MPVPSSVPPSLPPQPQHLAYRESRPAPIPMHQPRPQKAVSVADIETPATFAFNPPQPQQEQPFHHQVPIPANGAGYPPDVAPHTQTPLSHIPERAIHAQPFQPYDHPQPQAFYPPAYGPGNAYYPVTGAEFPHTTLSPLSRLLAHRSHTCLVHHPCRRLSNLHSREPLHMKLVAQCISTMHRRCTRTRTLRLPRPDLAVL